MSFWTQAENQARGDSPNWKPAPITERQREMAALYLVQCAILAKEAEKDARPGEGEE